jgi:hypothetical protein
MVGKEKVGDSEGREQDKIPQRDSGESGSSRYGLIMYCGLEKEDGEDR